MSRPVQRRFPARNPFGDKMIHRYLWTEGEEMSIPSTAIEPWAFTTMRLDIGQGTVNAVNYDGGIPSKMGTAPGLDDNIGKFQRYRVYQFICVTTVTNLSNVPVLAWHQPYASDVTGTDLNDVSFPSVQRLPEERWIKARMLAPAGNIRSTIKLITRINPYKIVSFDRGSTAASAYGVNTGGFPYKITAPTYGTGDPSAANFPWFRYGITTFNDAIPTEGNEPRVAYFTKVYLKVQHFDVKRGQGLN